MGLEPYYSVWFVDEQHVTCELARNSVSRSPPAFWEARWFMCTFTFEKHLSRAQETVWGRAVAVGEREYPTLLLIPPATRRCGYDQGHWLYRVWLYRLCTTQRCLVKDEADNWHILWKEMTHSSYCTCQVMGTGAVIVQKGYCSNLHKSWWFPWYNGHLVLLTEKPCGLAAALNITLPHPLIGSFEIYKPWKPKIFL